MDVFWLEQTETDVPAECDWLSKEESARLNGFRFPKRRSDWRLGRWTAKRAVAACLRLPGHPRVLAEIEIRPASSGAPEVFFGSRPLAVTISLSHRANAAICAVAMCSAALGCDLEVVEPRTPAFLADYFTPEEQALVEQAPVAARFRLLALLWSGKESAMKALRTGLRLATQSLVVRPAGSIAHPAELREQEKESAVLRFEQSDDIETWRELQVGYGNGEVFHGWWQQTGNLVRTLIAAPPPAPPVLLHLTGLSRHAKIPA